MSLVVEKGVTLLELESFFNTDEDGILSAIGDNYGYLGEDKFLTQEQYLKSKSKLFKKFTNVKFFDRVKVVQLLQLTNNNLEKILAFIEKGAFLKLEPFTGVRFYDEVAIVPLFKSFLKEDYLSRTRSMKSLSEEFGLSESDIYTILTTFGYPVQTQDLKTNLKDEAYITTKLFLSRFVRVSDKVMLKQLSNLKLPKTNIRFVGTFVERNLYEFLKDYDTQGKGETMVEEVTLNGILYKPKNACASYLRDKGVKVTDISFAASEVVNLSQFKNDKGVWVSKQILDDTADYYNKGYNFNLALAYASGKLKEADFEEALQPYQVKRIVKELETSGIVSKNLTKYLFATALPNISPIQAIKFYSKSDLEHVLLKNVFGEPLTLEYDNCISVVNLIDYLNNKGIKVNLKGLKYGSNGCELVYSSDAPFIVVSNSLIVVDKAWFSPKLVEDYYVWLRETKKSAVDKVKGVVYADVK